MKKNAATGKFDVILKDLAPQNGSGFKMWFRIRPLALGFSVFTFVVLLACGILVALRSIYSGDKMYAAMQLVILITTVALVSLPAFAAGLLSKSHGWLYGVATISVPVIVASIIYPSIPDGIYIVAAAISAGFGQFGQNFAARKLII